MQIFNKKVVIEQKNIQLSIKVILGVQNKNVIVTFWFKYEYV